MENHHFISANNKSSSVVFDRRIYVPFLNYSDRLFYFKNKLKAKDIEANDIEKWATDTEGLSIAHLAELIKSIVIFNADYQETIDTLKEMNEFAALHSSRYEKDGGRIGFQNKSEEVAVPSSNGAIHSNH